MKRTFWGLLTVVFITGLFISGCGTTQKAESGQEAIELAQALENTQEKVDYLIKQANAFYNSEEFQDAVEIAQHILRYLDRDSAQAKSLLEDAKEMLAAEAQKAISEFDF